METTHQPDVRPWGQVDLVDQGVGYQVKRLVINPGERLSYQRHHRRSEYWVVVQGTALVTLDDEQLKRTRGEMAVVPVGTKHRVENIGEDPLVFIEVRLGEYLEEDDVERFADDYGRS